MCAAKGIAMNRNALPLFTGLLAVLFALWSSSLLADGTLTHLSGTVSVQNADGKATAGIVGAKVVAGDTVVTGAGGYVRMEMTDGGEMVLRPESQLKIEAYKYLETKPAEDSFVFRMLKGGLRTVSGFIGKRGKRDAYQLNTSTSTIGIRGTQFDLRVCEGNCGALADGTYLVVRFGAVEASNPHGSLAVGVGQVAHIPPQRPPVMLPRDPGVGFTPPAVIPKLDEKKKMQAAEAAAAAVTPDQNSGPGRSTTSVPGNGEAASGNTASRSSVEGQTTSVTEISRVPLRSEPAVGGDCSVQ